MITAVAPAGVPEVVEGDDLAALLLAHLEREHAVRDGDVVVVTSKVVSKAEGRVLRSDRSDLLAAETVRTVARRGPTQIVRNRLGLIMAAAGIDGSNVPADHSALLPRDPDASARALRETLRERTGRNVGVIVTDTAGRAWRTGQTDIAIGAAGVLVLESFAGRQDAYGNPLAVTEPAVADEIAGLAELSAGKLSRRPFVLVRGRSDLVLPSGDQGTGAAALIRPENEDLFGFGAREAVLRAVAGDLIDLPIFGEPVDLDELVEALAAAGVSITDPDPAVENGDDSATAALARTVAFALGWPAGSLEEPAVRAGLRRRAPTP